MTTEEKLKFISDDIIHRLGEEILPSITSPGYKEKLRQIAHELANLDAAYQRLIYEVKQRGGIEMPEIKKQENNPWEN